MALETMLGEEEHDPFEPIASLEQRLIGKVFAGKPQASMSMAELQATGGIWDLPERPAPAPLARPDPQTTATANSRHVAAAAIQEETRERTRRRTGRPVRTSSEPDWGNLPPPPGTGPAETRDPFAQLVANVLPLGIGRAEVTAWLAGETTKGFAGLRPESFPAHLVASGTRLLYERHAPGYWEAREHFTEVQAKRHPKLTPTFISPMAWQRLSEYERYQFKHGEPYQTDLYGNVKPESQLPGYTIRKGASEQVPWLTRSAAFPAQLGGGAIGVTAAGEKMIKREQQMGRHQAYQVGGLETFQGVRAGPEAVTGDIFQRAYSLALLGGDPGWGGTGLIEKGLGPVTGMRYKELANEPGKAYTEPVAVGTRFARGAPMALAKGMAPEKSGFWEHEVTGVEELPGGGYGFTLRQSVPLEASTLAHKFAYSKSYEKQAELPAGLQHVTGLKDMQGAAYAIWQAEWAFGRGRYRPGGRDEKTGSYIVPGSDTGPEAQQVFREEMAREMGFPGGVAEMYAAVGGEEKFSYGAIGERAYRRFQTHAERYLREESLTLPMHESQLGYWEDIIASKTPVEGRPGQYNVTTVPLPGVYGPFGMASRFSVEYPAKGNRAFLSLLELERIREAEGWAKPGGIDDFGVPGTYQRIMERTGYQRAPYRGLINAALASRGGYEMPRGTLEASDPTVKAAMLKAMDLAQAQVEKLAPEGASPQAQANQFWQILGKMGRKDPAFHRGYRRMGVGAAIGNRPIHFQLGQESWVMQAPAQLRRFRAEGPYMKTEGLPEEVSGYLTAAHQAIQGFYGGASRLDVHGNEITPAAMLSRARTQQDALAEGKEIHRRALGATLSGRQGGMYRGVYDPILPEGTFWAPGGAKEGDLAWLTRNPSTGTEQYGADVQVRRLSDVEFGELGGSPGSRSIHLSGLLTDHASGDVDADLYNMVLSGQAQKGPDGVYHYLDQNGNLGPVAEGQNVAALQASKEQRLKEGRPSAMADRVQLMTREAALAKMQGTPLAAITPAKGVEEANKNLALYGYIPQTYTPGIMQRALARGQQSVLAAERYWGALYSRGQVPNLLPDELQALRDFENITVNKRGTGMSYPKRFGDLGKPAATGAPGLLNEAVKRWTAVVGKGLVEPDIAASLLSPGPAYEQDVAKALRGGSAEAVSTAVMGGLGQNAELAFERVPYMAKVGGLLSERIERRVAAEAEQRGTEPDPAKWYRVAGFANPQVIGSMRANAKWMRQYQKLHTKQGTAAEIAEAAQAAGIGGFVQPVGTAPAAGAATHTQPALAPEQAAAANMRAAIQPGQGPAPAANPPALRPETASPAVAAGGAVPPGGGGQPPAPPAAPPGDGGDGRDWDPEDPLFKSLPFGEGAVNAPPAAAGSQAPRQVHKSAKRAARERRTSGFGINRRRLDEVHQRRQDIAGQQADLAEKQRQSTMAFRVHGTIEGGVGSLFMEEQALTPGNVESFEAIQAQVMQLGSTGEAFQQIQAGTMTPRGERALLKPLQGMRDRLLKISHRVGTGVEGNIPGEAGRMAEYLGGFLGPMETRDWQRKIAQATAQPERERLSFDQTQVKLTDAMKKEIAAFEKSTRLLDEGSAESEKLWKAQEGYRRVLSMMPRQAVDRLGQVRVGVEDAEAKMRAGRGLSVRDVDALRRGAQHLDPLVQQQARDVLSAEGLSRSARGGWLGAASRGPEDGGTGFLGWATRQRGGGLGDLGWTMFNAQRWWRWTGGALLGWNQQYANEQMLAQQAGFAAGGPMQLSGAPAGVIRRQAAFANLGSALGESFNRVWGPTMDQIPNLLGAGTEDTSRLDALTRIMGIAGPVGVGTLLGSSALRMGARGVMSLGRGIGAAANWIGTTRLAASAEPMARAVGQAAGGTTGGLGLFASGLAGLIPPVAIGAAVVGAGALAGSTPAVQNAPLYRPVTSGWYMGPQGPVAAAQVPGGAAGQPVTVAQARGAVPQPAAGAVPGLPDPLAAVIDKLKKEGYSYEEIQTARYFLAARSGEEPTEDEMRRAMDAGRVKPGGLSALEQGVTGITRAAGGGLGTRAAKEVGGFYQGLRPAEQAQMEAGANIWGGALLNQPGMTPLSRAQQMYNLGAAYAPYTAQMEQYVPAIQNIFQSRGFGMPVNAPKRALNIQSYYGLSAANMDYMAGMYNTPMGWSLAQPMTGGAGNWTAGMYEETPAYGVQERGTAASFGLRARSIQRSYAYHVGQPTPAGSWQAGTAGGQATPFGATFGGGEFTGGIGFGLQGQLSMHRDMVDLTHSLRALNETEIKLQRSYQAQQLGFAMEGANLSYRQGMENIALAEKTYNAQVAYQRREMQIQQRQMTVQQGWTRQDLAYQQSVAGLQYGWQQEDYTRSIRFATGRERQQLRREQGRAQVMYTMEEGQRGRERDRFETSAKWQQEALQRQKEYFEQTVALQKEQFAMQRRHLTEQHNLQMRQIGAQMAYQQELYALQDKERVLQQDWEDKQAKYQEEQIKKAIELAELEKDDALAALANEEALAKARGEYNKEQILAISPGGTLWEAWKTFIKMIVDELNTARNGGNQDNYTGGKEGDHALGTLSSRGGKYLTGEYGPELVDEQPGSQVLSAAQTRVALGTDLPTYAPRGVNSGKTVVHVYLGTQELKQLMVETAREPAFGAVMADSGRRAANRRI